ncbi:transcriptional regulator [Pullulanibacillus camelliae]|uniref:Transcriptional regulator n=1 Tax=Pullulanibacillus camelliae TaxID=1707096 RepID=A0A8J2YND9_9BACL|nr:TrmB family transcriptional regulator [Pullulanibacillus camelliae]GGE56651.1 transcriptional regulator [Pullulanibacillus camelliae]
MLQQFGFSQYESKVFEVLVTSEAALDATAIVKYSGVPRSKVYEVIDRLIDKGMVLGSVSEKKKLYAALPMELVIEKLTTEFEDNVKTLKNNAVKKTFYDERVWSFKVESSIKAQFRQLVKEANQSIRLSLWKDDFYEVLPLLEDKVEQGIQLEALVVGEVETHLSTIHTLIPAEEHQSLEQFRLIIVDEREVLFAGMEEEHSWQAITTLSKPFVKVFTEFFYHDVALARITEKHGETLMNDREIRSLLMKLRY